MKKAILLTCLVLLVSCARKTETVEMCTTGKCPEVLPTKGPKGWPVQNNDSFVWTKVRAGTNFVADKTRTVRRETAKFLVPEDIITNEADYARFMDKEAAAAAEAKKPKPVYCYKSLGDANCYKEPQPGQESRLIQ